MALLSSPEMGTAFNVTSAYRLVDGELLPENKGSFTIALDSADVNICLADYMRPLIVSGLPENVRILFLKVVANEDFHLFEQTIGYFATNYDHGDGTATLIPGDLLEQDPRTWLGDGLRNDLFALGRETLEDFSLHALADHIGAL